jgi:chaperone required for assembly of F1-ATPase
MRELFGEPFAEASLDPMAAARRAMRPRPRRRFYRQVEVEDDAGSYRVVLDGRAVKTPARRTLAAPNRALGEALAAEWQAQRDVVDPAKMPLTRLASTVIDGVADNLSAVAAEVEKYLHSDLVCYRVSGPEVLVRRQEQAWDPVLAWAQTALDAPFVVAQEITFVSQPACALAAAYAAIPREPWRLGALHSITTLTGSALIALAHAAGVLSLENAWAAAHVDEDWNMELWGRDALALARRDSRFAEMRAAALVLQTR